MVIAQQPFCWKWISVTKISKYGKKWIFTSIERELHVSTPYGFLIIWHPFLILSLLSIIHFTWSDYYPPLPYSLSTLPWKTAMPKAINRNRKKSYDLLTVNWNAQSRDTIEVAPVPQTLDSAIHRMKSYPLDNAIGFPSTYPQDSGFQRLNNRGL